MNKEPIDWITINGQHVPIFEGENKREAVRNHLNKKMSRVEKNKDKYDKIDKFKKRKATNNLKEKDDKEFEHKKIVDFEVRDNNYIPIREGEDRKEVLRQFEEREKFGKPISKDNNETEEIRRKVQEYKNKKQSNNKVDMNIDPYDYAKDIKSPKNEFDKLALEYKNANDTMTKYNTERKNLYSGFNEEKAKNYLSNKDYKRYSELTNKYEEERQKLRDIYDKMENIYSKDKNVLKEYVKRNKK